MVKKKKMLTVDDLWQFCMDTNFARFSSKESGYQLAVQVPTTFEVEESSDDNHRGMMRLKFRILHDGLNRNKSFVPHKAAVKASATIADRPIMAAIHQLDDGTWDFKSHEMEIIEDENGNQEINYIEKQVGSFSSEKPFWEHDDEYDKDYLCAYGYIAEEYTKAADIIREKGGTKNSCELVIEEMSFNAKEKQLELNAFYLSASTLLGREDDGTEIGEGMLGSRADIADFSVENNSVFSQNKVIEMLSALSEKIDNLNINQNTSKKGGTVDVKKKFDEQTKEEIKDTPSAENFDDNTGDGVTPDPEDVDYYDDPNTEGEDNPNTEDSSNNDNLGSNDTPGENNEPSSNDDPSGGDNPSSNDDGDDSGDGDDDSDDDEPEGIPLGQRDDDDTVGDSKKKYSIEVNVDINGEKKTFSTLIEKLDALSELVNATYGEVDNDFYAVDADEDKKIVEMHQWIGGKHFRQSYSVKRDVYSLVGDRVETYAKYLTEDEIKSLDSMRSNYSSIEEKLAKYESEPAKKEILQSEDWKNIRETKEFTELSKRENYFDLSTDELTDKLDKMLLEYSKHNKIEFSSEEPEKKQVGMKLFGNPSRKTTKSTSRYGGLFSK